MCDYVLSCESTVDLSREQLAQRKIAYICYPYELDGVAHRDDFGETLSYDAFYAAMESGKDTKTAQINAYEFETYFEPFLKEGKDIVHLCLSSGITGILNSARAARSVLLERYPHIKERNLYHSGTIIGSHSGPGTVALFFWGDERNS